MRRLLAAGCCALVALVSAACERAATEVVASAGLPLDPYSFSGPSGTSPGEEPSFLLATPDGLLLWGEDRGVRAYRLSPDGLRRVDGVPVPDLATFDSLVAAGLGADGTLALLDWAGRVAAIDRRSGRTWRFDTLLRHRVSDLAVADGLLYFLLHGGEEDAPAVVGYRLTGEPAGSWGEMPPDGVIQSALSGGGIAACPDGSVFYSSINSQRIARLGSEGGVSPLGPAPPAFHRLDAGDIRRARRETERTKTVSAIVRLGLSGSRVMALRCSEEGLLLRQVARPSGAGAYVEVWDPTAGTLAGIVEPIEGLLVGSSGRTLLLATESQEGDFRLGRTMLPELGGAA